MTPSITNSFPPAACPEWAPATSPPYEAPALTALGAWTAVTLVISIPVGLNNVYNTSTFDTEF